MDPLRRQVQEIVIQRLQRRPFLREEAPGPTGTKLVEDGIENGAQRMQARAANGRLGWQERREERPLCIGQVGGVEDALGVRAAGYPTPPPARY